MLASVCGVVEAMPAVVGVVVVEAGPAVVGGHSVVGFGVASPVFASLSRGFSSGGRAGAKGWSKEVSFWYRVGRPSVYTSLLAL